MMSWAQVIRDLREDAGKTQEDIAKLLQTTQQYYGKYESGKHPLPIEHLITLCEFYGVSADYILGLPENLKYPKR